MRFGYVVSLLVFSFLVSGCGPYILEQRVRVVFSNRSNDTVVLNIGGDDFRKELGPQSTDQFFAEVRMPTSSNSTSPSTRFVQIPVSVTNLTTGRMSRTQQCQFSPTQLTTVEYTGGEFLQCQTNF